VVIVSVIAYLLTGHRSIYPAQRIELAKAGWRLRRPSALRDLHGGKAQQHPTVAQDRDATASHARAEPGDRSPDSK
jgi:hypothetical protein